MSAYYNENDPNAAAWLRQLIAKNLIPDGEVDERSIEDIRPSDLRGFRVCHFFAGIGGWAEALRIARWPHHREVWTGSCPCQPFSAAGEGRGTADERHLWPAWFYLIEECRPAVVFGEQVDASVRRGWLDLVRSDLEGIGYAFAPTVIPAASVGAPHARHRLWFVADAYGRHTSSEGLQRSWEQRQLTKNRGASNQLADADFSGLEIKREQSARKELTSAERGSEIGYVAEPDCERRDRIGLRIQPWQSRINHAEAGRRSEARGFWEQCDWVYCRDEKYRPVEPGSFPLAHGLPARVGRLRGYGNAIVPQVGAAFIKAYLSI